MKRSVILQGVITVRYQLFMQHKIVHACLGPLKIVLYFSMSEKSHYFTLLTKAHFHPPPPDPANLSSFYKCVFLRPLEI